MSWLVSILATDWLHALVVGLPYLLSAITIWMTLLAGNKHRSAWLVGLAAQAFWLVWIVATGAWGLLPMNFALWIVYGRNHLRWKREAAGSQGLDPELTKHLVKAMDALARGSAMAPRPLPALSNKMIKFRRYAYTPSVLEPKQ